MEQGQELKRVQWVDILKGLLILFVILGHSVSNSHIKNYISTFYMPCFFILSGWFMKKKADLGIYTMKRVKSILLPYLFFSIIWILFCFLKNFIIETDFNIIKAFVSIFLPYSGRTGGNVYNLWFLPCLFFSQIIIAVIIYNKKILRLIGIFVWFLFLVLGIIVELYCSLLYAISIASIFVFFGFIIQNYVLIKIDNNANLWYVLSLVICLILNIVCFIVNVYCFNKTLDFSAGSFGILPVYLIGAISGSLFFILLFRKIKSFKPLEYIGKNSLVYYALHYVVLAVVGFLIERVIDINSVVSIISFAATSVITTLVVVIYNKLNVGKIFK